MLNGGPLGEVVCHRHNKHFCQNDRCQTSQKVPFAMLTSAIINIPKKLLELPLKSYDYQFLCLLNKKVYGLSDVEVDCLELAVLPASLREDISSRFTVDSEELLVCLHGTMLILCQQCRPRWLEDDGCNIVMNSCAEDETRIKIVAELKLLVKKIVKTAAD
jgi:hypothetical protein